MPLGWKTLPRGRKLVWVGLVLLFGLVVAGWLLMERKQRLVFSDGSVFTIHRVQLGKAHMYYHNPARRTIARVLSDESWRTVAIAFPWLVKAFGISNDNACTGALEPCVVVFGQYSLAGSVPPLVEFQVKAPSTNSHPAMETMVLDGIRKNPKTPRWDGVCILAIGSSVTEQGKVVVEVYERNPANQQRTLVGTLQVKRVE